MINQCESAADPIAIVGMGCRYPGGVSTPDELWDLVAAGRCAITELPADRGWDLDQLSGTPGEQAGAIVTRFGGFVDGGADFDPEFFGVSPREAAAIHPAQRLIMMTAWEAIERAGIVPASLREQEVGVFVGITGPDYGPRWHRTPEDIRGRVLTGTAPSMVSGRLSYFLGVTGPSVSVDTACSSSSVAIHLACQSLRSGDAVLALAGGATFHGTPGVFTEFSRQGAMSPDGLCKSFADTADGTGWGEGAGMLLLAKLSDARRLGYPVQALIAGSAVNQDGPSTRLTAPNPAAQERVIRKALDSAGLTAADVDAVEAHGTGTRLGDPIEANAVIATYGQGRAADRPLWLGSLKSNIGHTVGAAGIGGIIKMVLALRRGLLPRTLHVDNPNPLIDWSAGDVRLLTEAVDWSGTGTPRRAGISSFGVSGTNAHIIVEEPPALDEQATVTTGSEHHLPTPWVISARTGPALREQARRLARQVRERQDDDVAAMAPALWSGRSRFEHRAIVTGTNRIDLLNGLDALAAGEHADTVHTGVARTPNTAAVFVFPGQGAQWAGMAAELLDQSPVFATELTACADALAPHCDWALLDVLRQEPGAASLDRVDVVQPALFAVMVALARLWQSRGVQPGAVIGHSQGEIAAAHIAGALTLPDAAAIVALRSRALRTLSESEYGMAWVALDSSRTAEYLASSPVPLSISALNSPTATVFSGPATELGEMVDAMEAAGHHAVVLPVDYASHSPQVESVRAELLETLADITPTTSTVPFYSTVTGGLLDTRELDAGYWYRNLRQPVQFVDAVRAALADDHHVFLEASPHPMLLKSVEDIAHDADTEAATVASLTREDGGATRFAASLAQAHVRGIDLNPAALFGKTTPPHIELPTYAFANRPFWHNEDTTSESAVAGMQSTGHLLVSSALELPDTAGLLLTGSVSLRTQPWLADHAVQGRAVLPGAAVAELAVRAGDEVGCSRVVELTLHRPVVLPETGALQLQVAVGAPDDDGRRSVRMYSRAADRSAGEWTRHADGLLGREDSAPARGAYPELARSANAESARGANPEPARSVDPWPQAGADSWPPVDADPIEPDDVYAAFTDTDIAYGPAFRTVSACWQRGDEYFAEVRLAPDREPEAARFGLHPILFDGALHLAALAGVARDGVTRLPFSWSGVSLHATGATGLRVRLAPAASCSYTVTATDAQGQLVLTVDSIETLPIADDAVNAGVRLNSLYVPRWAAATLDAQPPTGRWAMIGGATPAIDWGTASITEYQDVSALREALVSGEPAPDVAVLPLAARGAAPVEEVLGDLQSWLAEPHLAGTRLVVLTEHGVATVDGEDTDPGMAAVWGLVRSAQTEHPGRIVLLDTDAHPDSLTALPGVRSTGEPQLALRSGAATAFRLARERELPPRGNRELDPTGTVLITGGTGTLGGLFARHLVATHGVRHLMLAGRRGADAPGAGELLNGLRDLGAEVTVVQCDTGDRDSVAEMLNAVSAEHPLTAILHAAGTLDDALVESLTAAQVAAVMTPKATGALHLDELTRDHDLAAFVLFSSCAATFGNAGQANYAAANALLDGLAQRRRARGQAATTLAWGLWDERSAMTAHLDGSNRVPIAPGVQVEALGTSEGLALFDACWLSETTAAVPVRLIFDENCSAATIPPLLQALAPRIRRRVAVDPAPSLEQSAAQLVARLERMPEAEQRRLLVDLVREHAAAVLGQESPHALAPDQSFRSFGMESLGAVELRNRLSAATGAWLTVAVIFDHSSPAKLGAHLHRLIAAAPAVTAAPAGPVGASPGRDVASPSRTPDRQQATAPVEDDEIDEMDIDAMDVDALMSLVNGDGADSGTVA
ncbi:type I polyketide synthase [Nocardia sp. NPDC020380]|uniref:type I polyketide synthase n=1 Tax=Nocardia sp. NPDC020380 TaxID=3364309 RepID=UPI00379DBA99